MVGEYYITLIKVVPYMHAYTVKYVSSAHHVLNAHPPLQRQFPARGMKNEIVS